MIEIQTEKGELYSFDPASERVFKDGQVVPSSTIEPIYSNVKDEVSGPVFSGLLLLGVGMIISLSGKYNPVTNVNAI